METALKAVNQRRCFPPLHDSEIQAITKSVARYESGDDGLGNAGRERPTAVHVNWPAPLAEEAFHGVTGDLVRQIEPHSEADPAALLVQALVCVGNVIGRQVNFRAEADRHYTNLFAVIVGPTSKARKGTSFGHIQRILSEIDPDWGAGRIMSGLASGEGLIWAVRDEIRGERPVRERGRIVAHKERVIDAGVRDKRLLVVEPEFARVLQVAERESNTLSAVMRQAWDSGALRVMTKNQAVSATGAHISIIGHITKDELRRCLTTTAVANGFANRFLWVCARRSKVLPDGGRVDSLNFAPIISKLRDAIEFAANTGEVRRGKKARFLWHEVYGDLSEGKPGLLGSVTSRAEAQTMRLACVYAFLDCSPLIRVEHLRAALAVWRYCEDSARFIFGDALGDSTADEILRVLRQHTQGMTRNDIREYFQRNTSSAEISRALNVLQEHGLARVEKDQPDGSRGRPIERWFAIYAIREKRG
jgi:hypothetical protein